ncbi:MAG: hypothetical protein KME05_24830 [Gloeocapsa sp. UFS-A4-WI-NPMV-4B04]|jgi:hypothetical protein|nr:hypothetical protein [Gloeocapsa sp. UFS-A4-WI-NPMV-4B04]
MNNLAITPAELEKYKSLDQPIHSDEQYEQVLRAVRQLRGPIGVDGQEEEMLPEVVAVRKALVDRLVTHEDEEWEKFRADPTT